MGGEKRLSLSSERATYEVEVGTPYGGEELGSLLHEHAPRLLLVDVEMCEMLGQASLRHLRRLHPETDWVIGWSAPLPRWLDVLINSGARGAICWDSSAPDLMRALDAMLSGELWFPRTVMRWLYSSLLNKADDKFSSAPDHSETSAGDVTVREAQALALMRRGLTNKQIAERLDISINTVKKHLASAFEKRGLRCRRQILD